jgi:putative CocE/NonD family hydrolase
MNKSILGISEIVGTCNGSTICFYVAGNLAKPPNLAREDDHWRLVRWPKLSYGWKRIVTKDRRIRVSFFVISFCVGAVLCSADEATPTAQLNSETPATFAPKTESFDYVRRTAMIPMRDGVKLYTVILIPRGAQHAPILLTRTPYGADERIAQEPSKHLSAVLGSKDVADQLVLKEGYIRVLQDVRGKNRSEGDYVMTRPLRGPLNPTNVDHATDAYDTIDWLVKNVPESNGKVGILGISYDGFTTLMALFHPHPALRAAMPINPMVDGWMGDDWFHNGAFRQAALSYVYDQEATRESKEKWWSDHFDDYESWLAAGSSGEMARQHGVDQLGFYQKFLAHPAYDAFWQEQALDKLLAKEPLTVPVMLVHSLWDQEDIYGALHVFKAIKPKDTDNSKVFLVMGPWFHHQARLDGSAVGEIRFDDDTAAYFRQTLLRQFFDHFLKDDAPPADLAPVNVFETGTNRWERLPTWPAANDGQQIDPVPLYLQPSGKLGFVAPAAAEPGFDEYVSDPAKPVPFLPRPIHLGSDEGEHDWQTWLVRDQREASSRTDVLTFTSDVLTAPLKISGAPIVNLIASTTGTDGDFVVKVIDVYPDEVGRQPKMGGYQLMISADIFRGRYLEGFDKPKPIPANEKKRYRFNLPDANHVFLPGHRLMVQVQSSWFPLYDRNPQTYVSNIFLAKPADYQKASIKVFTAGESASFVELPVVKSNLTRR